MPRPSTRSASRAPLALTLALLLLAPRPAAAHGLFGHVHVTGWAIENLPPGELRDFFADPELFQAALLGAAFPDTGYQPLGPEGSRAYAETAHWEPFIEAFITRVRTLYGPTYDAQEEKLIIAFLLGCASHGLQDELFDSTFLYEVEQRDDGSQSNADPGTDGFLALDGHARLFPRYPDDFIPMEDLLDLYGEIIPEEGITSEMINKNVRTVTSVYLNEGIGVTIAKANGNAHRPDLPWASAHYLDASVPGSLRAEIDPTARHMQALWDRLHDRFDDAGLVVHVWPETPRRLREADHTSVASWVTLVLGKGVEPGTATGSIVDAQGVPHPISLAYTRWGGTSRIIRFIAGADYVPGGRYTLTLDAGATLVDGTTTSAGFEQAFQVECEGEDLALCPPLVRPPDPVLGTEPEEEPQAETKSGCAASPSTPRGGAAALVLTFFALVELRRRRAGRRR